MQGFDEGMAESAAALPADGDAERFVLGLLLRDNSRIEDLGFTLGTEDFYEPRHRLIFKHIQLLLDQKNSAADLVTVARSLDDMGELAKAGGKEYLGGIDELADLAANFEEYAKIIRDKNILRQLYDQTEDIRRTVHHPGELSCGQVLDRAESRILKIADDYKGGMAGALQRVGELTGPINQRIDELYERVQAGLSPLTGLRTHHDRLDEYTSGFQDSDLLILAARPSVGKTAFALDIARNVCRGGGDARARDAAHDYGDAVVIFSLEMSAEQLTKRLLSTEAKIDQHRLRSANIRDSESWGRLAQAIDELNRWPLWIDDTAMMSILEMRSRARRIKRVVEGQGKRLRLLVVDYLQLMDADRDRQQENRATEVSYISRGLKALARELRVPILALSQLSRKIEDSARPRRPQLSDLRESGAIEQDADVIMFLSRQPSFSDGDGDEHEVELLIGKHRNGPTGMVPLVFSPQFTHFTESDRLRSGEEAGASYGPEDPEDFHA